MLDKKWAVILGLLLSGTVEASPCELTKLIEMPIEELIDMTVSSASKTDTCITQAPNVISSYSASDLRRLGARTMTDILWLVAGVQVQTNPNNRDRIWMRGVQSEFNNKIALYIDHVPIKDVFGGFAIDEEIPVESIEKIEIIRGPGSTLYGANAFSGVIHIFTFQAGKSPNPKSVSPVPSVLAETEKAKNTVKVGLGEQNTFFHYGALEQNLANGIAARIEGKWLQTDGRKPDFNNLDQPNNRTGKQDLGYAHLNLTALDGELAFNGTYSHFDNTRVDKAITVANQVANQNFRAALSYKHQFMDNLGIDVNVYHTDTQRLETETTYDSNTLLYYKTSHFIDHTTLSGIATALNYKPHASNHLTAGFEVKREALPTSQYTETLTPKILSFIQNPRYNNLALTNYDLFIQDTQTIFSPATQLTVGVRYDILALFKNQFNYRLGLTHAFNDNFYAKLLYGTAYRAPNFVEFTREPVGTPLPKVESMRTLELQLGYQSQIGQISVTVYKNDYRDFLARKNSFNGNSLSLASEVFANVDQLKMMGTELESRLFIHKNWQAFLNASWSHARSINEQQSLPLLANWTVATGLEWREFIGNGELSFNNHIVIYGKRQDWSTNLWNTGQQQRYPNRDGGFTNGFAIWNSALHYKYALAKQHSLDFDLNVHNVLNQKSYTQSLIPPASNTIANFDTQYPGRQIRFAVSYSW